jgi:threonyl-tRNA synthetase
MAVMQYDSQALLGPRALTKNGFYHDFEFSFDTQPTKETLKTFSETIHTLIKKQAQPTKQTISKKEAQQLFIHNIHKLKEIDKLIEQNEGILLYKHGSFIDLCMDPRITPTELLHADAFALLRISGVRPQNEEKGPLLTRIYGYAFKTKDELDIFLKTTKK